jgi:hypothetical protein
MFPVDSPTEAVQQENNIVFRRATLKLVLSQSQVLRLLRARHQIAEDKQTALRGRLQHFQRLGFPEGINTGKGRPAHYGAGEVLLISLAFELLEMGLTPERAVHVLQSNMYVVTPATRITADWLLKGDPESSASMFLWFDPTGLSALKLWADDADMASETFFYGGLPIVLSRIQDWADRGFIRTALLNLTAIVSEICGGLVDEDVTADHYLRALLEWAEVPRD